LKIEKKAWPVTANGGSDRRAVAAVVVIGDNKLQLEKNKRKSVLKLWD